MFENPPLIQFMKSNLVKQGDLKIPLTIDGSKRELSQDEYLNLHLENELKSKPKSKLFLSAQAELLAKAGCTLLLQEDIGDSKGYYHNNSINVSVKAPQTRTTYKETSPKSYTSTFAHEMIHGIDAMYHCRSEIRTKLAYDEIKSIRKTTDPYFVENLSNTMKDFLDNSVMEPGVLGKEFVGQIRRKAIVRGELKPGELPEDILIPGELGTYIYESIFSQINNPASIEKFTKTFNDLAKEPVVSGARSSRGSDSTEIQQSKKDCQELVALSIYDVNEKMIEHFRTKGEEFAELLKGFEDIQKTIAPVYENAMKKECMKKLELYDDKKMHALLQKTVKKDTTVLTSALTEEDLVLRFQEADVSKKDGEYVIPLFVSASDKNFVSDAKLEDANHWVGLRITKTDKIICQYIDPMGHPMSDEMKETIKTALNIPDLNIQQPLLDKGIQYTQIQKNDLGPGVKFSEDSNMHASGQMLVDLMKEASHGFPLNEIRPLSKEKSFIFSQELRDEHDSILSEVRYRIAPENKEPSQIINTKPEIKAATTSIIAHLSNSTASPIPLKKPLTMLPKSHPSIASKQTVATSTNLPS